MVPAYQRGRVLSLLHYISLGRKAKESRSIMKGERSQDYEPMKDLSPVKARDVSGHRFPYGYLVTTSPQSKTPPWYGQMSSPKRDVLGDSSSYASGETYSQSVTGGVYRARVHIHRGMLIRDY
ncbi:hypothetical protein QJS04_geneDACA024809 [Acorus gramineus]|uniref:Uncharacterized protein n=1 Tax=Acorus gramineus TaxID=55184 RepID=A0AAV9A3E2_ACOGR|nr:hypothetical protein QJS04_geneDACA024809 [Acorus gramineus]